MLWDIVQQQQIGSIAGRAERAMSRAENISSQIRDVDDRIDRLVMINVAMWSLLSEKVGLTEQHLIDRMTQLDLTDGRLDGKVRVTSFTCPSCQRAMSKRRNRCLYCGHAFAEGSAFGGVL